MRNVTALKHVIQGYIDRLEVKYSTCAFQVKERPKGQEERSSLKMYLTIKESPIVKKYVLTEAIKWLVSEHPEVDNLALFEARYDLEREMGIKK